MCVLWTFKLQPTFPGHEGVRRYSVNFQIRLMVILIYLSTLSSTGCCSSSVACLPYLGHQQWGRSLPTPALWPPQPVGRQDQEVVKGCQGCRWLKRICCYWYTHHTHIHRKSSHSGTLTADLLVTNNTMLSSWRSESLTCLLLQTGWVLSALCGRSTDRDKARQDSVILRNNTNTDVRSQGTSRTQRERGWSLTWPIWGSSHSYEKIVLKWNMWFWGKCSFYSYFEVFVKNCLFFLSLSLFVSLLWSHVGGSCRKRVSFFTSLKASTPKNHTKELAATKGDCHIMSHFFSDKLNLTKKGSTFFSSCLREVMIAVVMLLENISDETQFGIFPVRMDWQNDLKGCFYIHDCWGGN